LAEILEQKNPHIINGTVIGRENHPPPPIQTLHSAPNGNTARQDATISGSKHRIILFNGILAAQIIQPRVWSTVSDQNGPRIGSIKQDRRARRHVCEQQDTANPFGDPHHTPHQSILIHHRIADFDLHFRADIDQTRIGKRSPGIRNSQS